jgi:hypothetical protein
MFPPRSTSPSQWLSSPGRRFYSSEGFENRHGRQTGRSNWAAPAAIVLGLVAALAYGLSWVVPTEAETGVRRTIGDVGIVIALAYILAVGPLLGIAGAMLVETREQKLRATIGFLFGFVGLAGAVGSMVACTVSDGCFH